MRTYDVVFHSDTLSANKGFKISKAECVSYIRCNIGSDDSYFADFKGGSVVVLCRETEKIVYSRKIPK